MTDKQKKRIEEYRNTGFGYTHISKLMDISVNSVKSYCKRHGLGDNQVFTDRKQLDFWPLMVRDTFAYLWEPHPLAKRKEISLEELKEYPCVNFDQSSDSQFYLSEETLGDYEFGRLIKSNDRATSSELMAKLNGYSIGTGIMTDSITLRDGFVSIKLKEEDPLTIGYMTRKNHKLSDIGEVYLEELRKYQEKELV